MNASQKAIDAMFAGFLEDACATCAGALFKQSFDDIPGKLDGLFGVVEAHIPESGFINGTASPTTADLSVLVMIEGFMAQGAAMKLSGYDYASKFPKMARVVSETSSYPAVADFLASSDTMGGNPMGL